MLQNKDIKNLSELKLTFLSKQKKSEFFFEFVDVLKIGKFHSLFSKVKQKGISSLMLIRIMISLPFIEQGNIHSFSKSSWNLVNIGKDAFYRLKNNPFINWRRFLFNVARTSIQTLEGRNKEGAKEQNDSPTAFVFDDSPTEKRGYKIEGVSRIWNHVIQKSVLGYQLLVMGYFNRTTLLPVNFSLHREKGKNKKKLFGLKPSHYKKQYKKKRQNKSEGAIRKKELGISKIDSVINMIIYAVKNGITADYVLTDSWFTCWELVETTIECNMNFIGMFSKVKTLFGYNGKQLAYKEIRRLNKGKIKRNKRFNLYYIRTVVDWHGKTIVLYHTRKGKRGKWKTLLSTDLRLDFTKTVEVYQIRWSIEVFFKESKQMLNLGKSQSNDFDGQIADTTISLIQYNFLSIRNSVERYETIGGVFKNTKEDIKEIKIHQRLIALLIAILEAIDTIFEEVDIDDIFVRVINDDEVFNKISTLISIFNSDLKNAA